MNIISFLFRYAFPFEGNWNPKSGTMEVTVRCSDTLSRLKGIETRGLLHGSTTRKVMVQIRFPVWRELKRGSYNSVRIRPKGSDTLSRLKGIETPTGDTLSLSLTIGSDTLSRLKGIETWFGRSTTTTLIPFRYAFPFEGNWNFFLPSQSAQSLNRVQIRFPVWRELKLSRPRLF